jgi:hypothetical protein
MANTPPEPPIRDRDNKKLLEDLCIGLRNVGLWDSELPDGDTVRNYIEETKMIHAELKRRGVDVDTRVSQLSDESGWLMGELLEDCLDFPKTLPYVKEADGIRRYFRCWLCVEREFTAEAKRFLLCEDCLHRLSSDIKKRVPSKGVMLYRTYNEEKRCQHANSDTILATLEQISMFLAVFVSNVFRKRLNEQTMKAKGEPNESLQWIANSAG